MTTYPSRSDLDIDLNKYLLVLRRRWVPATFVLAIVTALSVLFAISREAIYQTSGKVQVKLDRTSSLAGLDVPGTTSRGEPNTIGLQSDPIATEVETVLSLSIANETISLLSLKNADGSQLRPEDFFSSLEVKPIPGTDMFRISYTDTDPELAAAVVNTVIDVYRQSSIVIKQSETVSAREFIELQLPAIEAEVSQSESDLQNFKEKNQIIALDEESVGAVQSIQQLDSEIAQAQAQLSTANAQSNDLQKRLGMSSERALRATSLSQSPAVQETLAAIRDVQNQLALAQARYRSAHPTIASLERQELELQKQLKGRISEAIGIEDIPRQDLQMGLLEQDLTANLLQLEVERIGLSSRINELNQVRATQRGRADALPRLEATQRQLERRLAVAQSTYETLLQRLQEVQVAENQAIDNIRIVSQALVPDTPKSSKKLIVVAGFLVGLILATITAFGLDLLDRRVKTVDEARKMLGLPILGAVPSVGKKAPFLIQTGDIDSTSMNQAYRMLQANLNFANAQAGNKSIVVTSSVSGEGRSRVVANLALAMSQAGSVVLLVDADLSKPDQHHIWNCHNEQGFLQAIEKKIDLEDAAQAVAPNLFVLPLGPRNEHFLSAFGASKINDFISRSTQKFDVVLFDASPLTERADASTLGNLADATLFVVRLGLVKQDDIKAAMGLINLSGQIIVGTVMNGVKQVENPSQYFVYSSELPASYYSPQQALTSSSSKPKTYPAKG